MRFWRLCLLGIVAAAFLFGANPSKSIGVQAPERIGVYNNGFWFLDADGSASWDGGSADLQHQFGWDAVTPFVGDWDGDGRDSSGIFINGFWFLDADGDGQWDGPGVDIQAEFGWIGVTPLVGDWNGDGRDKIGIFINGYWFFDYNGNGVWEGPAVDRQAHFGWAGVTPILGDWNGDGRDKVAIYANGFWYYDRNGNYMWDGPVVDRELNLGWDAATPLVGDWNGDGADESAVWANGWWYLDFDGNQVWDGGIADKTYSFALGGARPVTGDWNGDGADEIGLFSGGAWRLDRNGNGAWDGAGQDVQASFGQTGDRPVVGRWKQPASPGPGVYTFFPSSGSEGVPYRTRVIVALPESIHPASATAANVKVLTGGVAVGVTRVVSEDGRYLSLRGPFQPGTQYTVSISGLFTPDNRPLAAAASIFRTGASPYGPSFSVLRSLPVPPSTSLDFGFTGAIDPTTITSGGFTVENALSGRTVPASCKAGADLRSIECSVAQPLPVKSRLVLRAPALESAEGRTVINTYGPGVSFDTGLLPDTKRPRVVRFYPANGSTDTPGNTARLVVFDEPVAAHWPPPDIRLTRGGQAVPIRLEPASNEPNALQVVLEYPETWQTSSTYVLTVNQAYDAASLPLANPGASSTFVTSASGQNYWYPEADFYPNGGTAPPNARIGVVFNTPFDPQTLTPESLRIEGPGGPVSATFSVLSPTEVRILPSGGLSPLTTYTLAAGPGLRDLFGLSFSESRTFTTSDSADFTPPQVEAVLPPDGATGVPTNQIIGLRLSESVRGPSGSIRVERANGEVVRSFLSATATDQLYTGTLLPNQQYRIVIDGAADLAGNPMPPFQSSFTTGVGSVFDTTDPTIVSSTPAQYAVDVPLTPTITVEFSEPVDPSRAYTVSLATSYFPVPVRVVSQDGWKTVQITPLEPLAPGRRYSANLTGFTDWSGNPVYLGLVTFTTQAGPVDETPPSILSISPPAGSVVEVGADNRVTFSVQFSEAVDSSALGRQVFSLLDGITTNASTRFRIDNAHAEIFVPVDALEGVGEMLLIIGPDAEDFYGNRLGSELRHAIQVRRTPPSEPLYNQSILDIRPASGQTGVPRTSPITFITSAPIQTTNLDEKIAVSVNGVLAAGVISTRADAQVIEFYPAAAFPAGALVQVFLLEPFESRDGKTALDRGIIHENTPYYFWVDGPTPSFDMVSRSTDGVSPIPSTLRPRLRFSAPIDPATVNSASVRFWQYNWQTGHVPIAGTPQVVGAGDVIEFQPAQPLQPNTGYFMEVLTTVRSIYGVSLANVVQQNFTSGLIPDVTPPKILSMSPANELTGVPLNARITIAIDETIDPTSISKQSFVLQSAGPLQSAAASWAIDEVLLDSSRKVITVIPLEALRPITSYQLLFLGAADASGLSTGQASVSFTTSRIVDAKPPNRQRQFELLSNMPPTSAAAFYFDEAIDLEAFAASTVRRSGFSDPVPGVWSLGAEGRAAIFTPNQPFAVGSTYTTGGSDTYDLAGNTLGYYSSGAGFSTGFGPDTTGPVVTQTSIPDGAVSVTPFPRIVVKLSEAIHPDSVTASTVRLLDGSTALPASVELGAPANDSYGAWSEITVHCKCALELARTYVLEIRNVSDLSGNALLQPYRLTFTTRGSYDFSPPTLSTNVRARRDLFRQISAKIRSNEPLDPATVTSANVHYLVGGAQWPGTVSLDASGRIMRIVPTQTLPASSLVEIEVTTALRDLAGNALSYRFSDYFYTGVEETDTQPPYVASVAPPDGAANVPVNAKLWVLFNEPFDLFAPAMPYRLLGPGGIEVDRTQPLLPNTAYVIDVPAVGTDFADLPFPGEQFSFTTGAVGVVDTDPPALLGSTPADGATGIPASFSIDLAFSEPVVLTPAMLSYAVDNNYVRTPMQIQRGADPTLATLSTLYPPPAGAAVTVYLSAFDFAGNYVSVGLSYTISTASDSTPPRVLSINPPDGATGVMMADVVLELSEPVQRTTIGQGVRMFLDGAPISNNYTYANGGTSLKLTPSNSLTSAGVITVLVTPTLLDLAGNPAEAFISRFELAPPSSQYGAVSVVRPGDGAQGQNPDAAFHLFFTKPIDPTSAQAATLVSENGVLISGAVTVASNDQVLTFTPSRPYVEGAEVRLFLDQKVLKQPSGEPYGNYVTSHWFRVGPGTFAVTSGSTQSERPRNTQPVLRFNLPLDPATVTPANVSMRDLGVDAPVAVNLTLEDGGRQLRITPQALLVGGRSHSINIGTGLRSTSGEALASPYSASFAVSSEIANVAPSAQISPGSGVEGVGVNGAFVIRFDGPFESATVNQSTVSWTDGTTVFRGAMIESSQSAYRDRWTVLVTPDAPLAPSTQYQITLAGAQDMAGNPVPTITETFSTASAPDLRDPLLASFAPSGTAPRNTAVVITFDEPMNAVSLSPESMFIPEPPVTFTQMMSADGRSVILLPDAPFPPNVQYTLRIGGAARDLSGNSYDYLSDQQLYIGDTIETTPPQPILALPAAGAADVSIDSKIVIQFDREIRESSLDPALIRVERGGVPINLRMSVTGYGKFLEISPAGLFDPLTPYVWTVEGVEDLAGNVMAAPISGSFSTGPAAFGQALEMGSASPAEGAVGVSRVAPWTVVFNQALNPSTVNPRFLYGQYEPLPSWTLSADGKTLTVTPAEPLPAQHYARLDLRPRALNGRELSVHVNVTTGN